MMEVFAAEEATCDTGEFGVPTDRPEPIAALRAVAPGLGSRSRPEMYQAFFHLEKSPFGMNPDPNCIFMTQSHREAFAGLLYAISHRKGFLVLTGDAGTGKTTLLRALMRSAGAAKFSLILTPRVNSDEFLEMALMDFGITNVPTTKSQRIFKLQELLMDLHAQGQAPVLIVDEAHTLSPENLEEIRLLTNFETSEQKLLQIVLAGQSDLAALLNRDDLRQLKQRIEVRMDIKPLAPTDVQAYIQYRWNRAGGSPPLPFSEDALALITNASRGIPRLVNSICDSALLLAYAGIEPLVSTLHIKQVLRDFDLNEPEPGRSNGRTLPHPNLNGKPTQDVYPEKRSSIAPRPFLGVEDDGPPQAKSSFAMRWADRMSLGFVQSKRDKE